MSFVIPIVIIRTGVSFIVWGHQMIITDEDFIDEKVGEFFNHLPEHIQQFISNVEISSGELRIHLNSQASLDIKRYLEEEIRNNVELN